VPASGAPKRPLELFSFESSPYSRRVRELLCELELPYLLRSSGKAQWQDLGPPIVRATLFPELPVTGRNRSSCSNGREGAGAPCRPEHGTEMFESDAIREYLMDIRKQQRAWFISPSRVAPAPFTAV
jgi:hypothetical protein